MTTHELHLTLITQDGREGHQRLLPEMPAMQWSEDSDEDDPTDYAVFECVDTATMQASQSRTITGGDWMDLEGEGQVDVLVSAVQAGSTLDAALSALLDLTPENLAHERAHAAGFRVHQGTEEDEELAGRWWWTCQRPAWSGAESGEGDYATADEAWDAAVAALDAEAAVPA
jgi:hypothetical protein